MSLNSTHTKKSICTEVQVHNVDSTKDIVHHSHLSPYKGALSCPHQHSSLFPSPHSITSLSGSFLYNDTEQFHSAPNLHTLSFSAGQHRGPTSLECCLATICC